MEDIWDLLTNDSHSDLFLTSALVALLTLGPMVSERRAGTFSAWRLKTAFLVFVFFQFGVWPVMMYVPRYDKLALMDLTYWNTGYGAFVRGQWYVIAGLLAFYVGYYQNGLVARAPALARWVNPWTPISDRRYRALLVATVGVTLLAFSAMMASSGGIVYFLTNIDLLRTTQAAGWGIFVFPIIASQIGITLVTARYMEERRSLALPILGTVVQLACGFVIGIRALLIAPIVSYLFCYHVHRRPIRFTAKVALGAVAFLVFNMWYAVFRGSGELDLNVLEKIPLDLFVIGLFGRFHGGESMSRIITVTDLQGYNYGLVNLQDFFVSFLPRALFPDKPPSAGVLANTTFWPELFSADDTGAAVPTLFGEAYWAMGVPMILLVLYLHGVVFRRIEGEMVGRNPIQTTVYSAFFVYALLVNETFGLHFFTLAFKLMVLAGLLALARTHGRRQAQTA